MPECLCCESKYDAATSVRAGTPEGYEDTYCSAKCHEVFEAELEAQALNSRSLFEDAMASKIQSGIAEHEARILLSNLNLGIKRS